MNVAAPPKKGDGSPHGRRRGDAGGRTSRKRAEGTTPPRRGATARGARSSSGDGHAKRSVTRGGSAGAGSLRGAAGYRSGAGRHDSTHRATGHREGDGRSVEPRSSRGPRDRLVEEVRNAAPRAKQAAAVASFESARELLQKGRDGAAAQAAEEAKRLAPRSVAVRELLGVALYRAGRYRDALRELQAYRRISGRLDENHLIADSYRGLGMPEKAVPVAREAVGAKLPDETRAEAAIVGAAALADLSRFEEALSLLHRFPPQRNVGRPWELRLWYVTGDVLDRAGRRAEAAEEFRRVVRYDADAFDAAERLASLN